MLFGIIQQNRNVVVSTVLHTYIHTYIRKNENIYYFFPWRITTENCKPNYCSMLYICDGRTNGTVCLPKWEKKRKLWRLVFLILGKREMNGIECMSKSYHTLGWRIGYSLPGKFPLLCVPNLLSFSYGRHEAK